jgi:hypothetical protein
MGDMGCHLLDGPFWACELGDPLSVESSSEDTTLTTFPAASTIECHFKSAKFGNVKLTWMDGGRKPERPIDLDPNMDWEKMKGGCIYRGEEGTLICPGDNSVNPRILNAERHAKWLAEKAPAPSIERATVNTPQLELVQAIEKNAVCGANFEYSVPLTRLCLIGNVAALLPGKKLNWDSAAQRFVDAADANAFLKRERTRTGWEYSAANL